MVRRVLHAVMTEDTFTVMGGHSAAAAHGNHFQQSYYTDSRVLASRRQALHIWAWADGNYP
jgi:hypothetical protein